MDEDTEIKYWKFKKLVQMIKNVKGDGTSLVTELIPMGKSISDATDIAKELGTASNIKSRVNRQSVLSALTSLQQARKNYNKAPEMGLGFFVGEGFLNGVKKKWMFKFDETNLIKPITRPLYECGSEFRIEHLEEMLSDDRIFGFIIVDGESCLFGKLKGKVKEVIAKLYSHLPGKTRRGGQSAARIDRNREIAINEFIKNIVESANRIFLTSEKVNVESIIIAGSASKKDLVREHSKLDTRVKEKIEHIIDISDPMEEGFNQAVEASLDFMDNLKYKKEKDLLNEFLLNITLNNGLSVYGVDATIKAFESGAMNKLIIWEDIKLYVHCYSNRSGETTTRFSSKETFDEIDDFAYNETVEFTDWIMENYKKHGSKLHFVSNNTEEGYQYAVGFGGIGGVLHYKVDMDFGTTEDDFLNDEDYFF